MAHWAERYLAPPTADGRDCGDLVREVMRAEFGRDVPVPTTRATGLRGLDAQIVLGTETLADPVDDPIEGDAVVMRAAGRRRSVGHHVGVYCEIGGRGHVLHRTRGLGTRLDPIDALERTGLEATGTYRWR